MMSDQEMNERIEAVQVAAICARVHKTLTSVFSYSSAVRICQHHQFTAAAEGLLEAAERMVGIEREEARAEA